jgi:hypothetical protein
LVEFRSHHGHHHCEASGAAPCGARSRNPRIGQPRRHVALISSLHGHLVDDALSSKIDLLSAALSTAPMFFPESAYDRYLERESAVPSRRAVLHHCFADYCRQPFVATLAVEPVFQPVSIREGVEFSVHPPRCVPLSLAPLPLLLGQNFRMPTVRVCVSVSSLPSRASHACLASFALATARASITTSGVDGLFNQIPSKKTGSTFSIAEPEQTTKGTPRLVRVLAMSVQGPSLSRISSKATAGV